MNKIILFLYLFIANFVYAETNWSEVNKFLDMPRQSLKYEGVWSRFDNSGEGLELKLNTNGTGIACEDNGYYLSAYELNYLNGILYTVIPHLKIKIVELNDNGDLIVEQNGKKLLMRQDHDLFLASEKCAKILK
jgi:hypothetical protein